ncbi:hypothetical protein D9615_000648 [Tricholomella constricta]|uniref:Uncharacterized protein n=1 Tax=Tricholomella constricta TaxID=117010 RepID=A0A8H5HQV3_9AGAR|nr:hypothetical protein D9615_000648 [Tricholomella constricta]
MIPLIPALALAFFSFICSAFVILRIVIPILPPHPLSKRVSPAEFGLPKFRSLSPADKSHIWLASLDLLALSIFVWQTINEAVGGPSDYANSSDPASAVRLWFVLTIRQTCLLIVAAITLLHVRMGRSVSFGARHWMLWAPTLLLAVTSTAVAGVIAGTGVQSLFIGLISYTTTIAVLSSVAFACLIGTLVMIKRNLAALNEESNPWPPVRLMEEKPRPSFATEEIDAIRDGASWITSNASSRQNSISGWSFSTHQTGVASSHHGHGSGRAQTGSHPSVPAKSSYWFSSSTPNLDDVPPVPPLPSPYGPLSPTAEDLSDPDPFRRESPSPLPDHPRVRLESQTSWLTSTNGSHTTMSAWSYPASVREGTIRNASTLDLHTPLTAGSRPVTPQLANAQVLGGYGFAPGSLEAEKGLAALAAPSGTTLDISMIRLLGWLIIIWVPIALSIPYLITVSQRTSASTAISVLFVLSVTLSSPLLALSILFRSPLPIPSGLFDVRAEPSANVIRGPSPANTESTYKWSHDYKRSMSTSVTVVEGRRSGDVWLTNGDAVDGKSKMSRAVGMLSPLPKLSVLPPEENLEDGEFTPPLPIQNDDSSIPVTIHNTPHSETSAQFGRLRKDSKASSHFSGGDESLAFASRIMIAQRHYSTLAQTVVVTGSSPEKPQSADSNEALGSASGATTANAVRHSTHLRTRSVSSISGPQTPTSGGSFNISPPPSFPLPPTPPNVRAARLASLAHKKSFSSGFSFGPVDDLNEIDALTAGVLPLLVPGINTDGMKIKEDRISAGTFSKSKGKKLAKKLTEFGQDFSSPEIHSTPARRRPKEPRERKTSAHKRNHFSLPRHVYLVEFSCHLTICCCDCSLGLGKDGIHSLTNWSADIRGALEHKVGQYTAVPSNVDLGRRNTVFGGESVPNIVANLQTVQEHEDYAPVAHKGANLGRSMSTRSLGLRAEVPHSVNSARSSVTSMVLPTSAASTVTLFEEFAGFESEPQAQSTPHNTVSKKATSRDGAPPLPKQSRRSSIVYIKSDQVTPTTNTTAEPTTTTSTMSALAQWSTRAVRPLIPKASKLQRQMTNADSSPSGTKPGSPSGNLRPLTLLQDRDTNTATPVLSETRPLTLGKRQKSRGAASEQDENSYPDSISSRNKNLKPLKLARSDTSKLRGVLRKSEVLPDVVVRPPSTTEHTGFAYSFNRD